MRCRPIRLSRFRRVVDLIGLTLVHAAISMLATAAVFAVFADAFRALDLDRWAGSFLIAEPVPSVPTSR